MKIILLFAVIANFSLFPTSASALLQEEKCSQIVHIGDSITVHSHVFQKAEYKKIGYSDPKISAGGSRTIFNKLPSDTHTGMQAVKHWKKNTDKDSCWIIALGTNDSGFYKNENVSTRIVEVMKELNGVRVAWVSVWKGRNGKNSPSAKNWNKSLHGVANKYPNMFVIEWDEIVSKKKGLTNPDGVHYGSTGSRIRAKFIAKWVLLNWQ